MEFLDLPDEIIIDMMISKISLAEITNFVQTNRHMRSLFQEIRDNFILYRSYLDSHFIHLKEYTISIRNNPKDNNFIILPYDQKVYAGKDIQYYRKRINRDNIISMKNSLGSYYYYLTDLGEVFVYKDGISTKIGEDQRFIYLGDDHTYIYAIAENGDLYFADKGVLIFSNITLNDPYDILFINKGFGNIIKIFMNTGSVITYRGDIFLLKEQFSIPRFIVKEGASIKFIPINDPSIMIDTFSGRIQKMPFRIKNTSPSSSLAIFLIDTDNNIYQYSDIFNRANKLQLILDEKDITGTIDVFHIEGETYNFIIIDTNDNFFSCKINSTVSKNIVSMKQIYFYEI